MHSSTQVDSIKRKRGTSERKAEEKKTQVLSSPPQNKMTELEYVIGCSTPHYYERTNPTKKREKTLSRKCMCVDIVRASVGLYLLRNIHLASTSSYR